LKKNKINNISTSWHGLNADRGLTRVNKIKWIIYNYINNLNENLTHSDLRQLYFDKINIDHLNQRFDNISSPARLLSDHFWYNINWSDLSTSLNNKINAIEIGCGNGKYGLLLNKYLNNSLNNYTGIDVKDIDDSIFIENKKFNFILGNSNSISKYLKGHNLIITQSALEHFDEDLTFFKQIVEYVNNSNQPIIQIHLMPSVQCLYTFLWHGVRQYSPHTISKFTRNFNENTKKFLYSLGGKNCNKVHQKYITFPRILRKNDKRFTETDEYNIALNKAIKMDHLDKNIHNSSFYGLVLISNLSKSFFFFN